MYSPPKECKNYTEFSYGVSKFDASVSLKERHDTTFISVFTSRIITTEYQRKKNTTKAHCHTCTSGTMSWLQQWLKICVIISLNGITKENLVIFCANICLAFFSFIVTSCQWNMSNNWSDVMKKLVRYKINICYAFGALALTGDDIIVVIHSMCTNFENMLIKMTHRHFHHYHLLCNQEWHFWKFSKLICMLNSSTMI